MHIRNMLAAGLSVILSCSASFSQTLFTYGNRSVSRDEFLKAFNKNPDTTGSREDKLKEYLDMYVNFKLKIQAARDEKLNLDETYKSEGENFKNQLAENYINDQANVNGLIREAFDRSQKDILLAQVFVELKPGQDTAAAYQRIRQAEAALQSGKDFGEVAATYSTDEGVKQAKGNIGYITVFVLPYEVENIVYDLKPGDYSAIYRSSAGYHIFRNVGERPAIGKRKIQQILLPLPPGYTEAERNDKARLADSIYQLLLQGASFEEMVQAYGGPNAGFETGNETEVGVGQYDAAFENEVFGLKKAGDLSKPFATAYGYNIIRLVAVEPVNTDESDVVNRAHLQEKVEQDQRLAAAKEKLVERWLQQTKYKPAAYQAKDLWAYSDSILLKGKTMPSYRGITKQTVLFSFAKQKVTVADWIQYNMQVRQTSSVQKDYSMLMRDFIKASCAAYYRTHIEDFYPAIAEQVREFNEANLLFAVMDRHVWSRASEDTVGLRNYYLQHKSQYKWQPGVSALVVSSASKQVIDSVATQLKQHAGNWRGIIAKYNNTVVADSSRFEDGQLPLKQKVPMQRGFVSEPEQNEAGDAYTLVYVFDVHHDVDPRSFDDARGLVINDYQQVLEQKWISELKKKYPVKINDAVAKNL